MLQREVDGDRSTARHPDDICAVNAHMVEQVGDVLTVGKGNILGERLPETTRIIANNAELLSEDWNLSVPHPAVGHAGVDQQERVSASGYFIIESCAGDLYETSFNFHHAGGLACRGNG